MVTSISIGYASQPVPFSNLNLLRQPVLLPLLRLLNPQTWGPLWLGHSVLAVWRCLSSRNAGQLQWVFLGDDIVDRESSWKFILWILLDRRCSLLSNSSPRSLSNCWSFIHFNFLDSTLHNGFRRWGFYLYIGLILSGYNVPLSLVFVNSFCLILCTKN